MCKLEQCVKWISLRVCDRQSSKKRRRRRSATSNSDLICMNLHSSSHLQSKNINIIELFAMITVYKAAEDERWLVLGVRYGGGKTPRYGGVRKEEGINKLYLERKEENTNTGEEGERQSEETPRHFDSLQKCSGSSSNTTTRHPAAFTPSP